jgi:hypothetical protein
MQKNQFSGICTQARCSCEKQSSAEHEWNVQTFRADDRSAPAVHSELLVDAARVTFDRAHFA